MSRKIAIKTAAIAAALGAMTSVAWAESMELTDAQMDQVAAGVGNNQTHTDFRVLPAYVSGEGGGITIYEGGGITIYEGGGITINYVRGDGSYFP